MKPIIIFISFFFCLTVNICPAVSAYHDYPSDFAIKISDLADAPSVPEESEKNSPKEPGDAFQDFQKDFNNREDDFNRSMEDDFFKSFNDQLKEMEQLRMEMEKKFKHFNQPFDDRLGDKFENFLNGGPDTDTELNLQTREDDTFVYFDIDVGENKPDDLKVDVNGHTVTISGKVSKNESLNDKHTSGTKTWHSQFVRSFPAPAGVEVDKADVSIEDKRIVIKFPKN